RAPSLAAALLALAVPAHAAEPYVAAQVGSVVSTATSNDDELEHGSEREWSFGLAAGARFAISSRVRARVELEASTRKHELHGRNGPGCSRKCSADHLSNNTMRATSLMLNVAPELALTKRFAVYGLAGVGGAYVTALHDHAWTPAGQLGAGVSVRFAPIEVDIGYRYWTTAHVTLDGQRGRYATHGPVVGVAWSFSN